MNPVFKEYAIENNQPVELNNLTTGFIPDEEFTSAHKNVPIVCHDAFIEYEGGILMVERDNVPAKHEIWCIGGRIQRGITTVDSLRKKVRAECGLELESIEFLGTAREFFTTDPFGHDKGTDTPSLVFYAKGIGEIKLDNLHKNPIIVKPEEYQELRKTLHPYMQDFMDIAFEKMTRNNH